MVIQQYVDFTFALLVYNPNWDKHGVAVKEEA